MRRARFVAAARQEFLKETAFYAEAEPGLGERFAQAITEATSLALAFPMAGFKGPANTRSVVVKGFPFSVVYRPTPDEIVIFAVAHHARRPGYWLARSSRH